MYHKPFITNLHTKMEMSQNMRPSPFIDYNLAQKGKSVSE